MTRCNYALRRRPKSPKVLWTDFVILPHRTTAPIYRQDHQTVQTANSLQKLHIKTPRQYNLCLSSGVYALRCARTRPKVRFQNHYRSENVTRALRRHAATTRFAGAELARKFVFKITIAVKTSLAPCEDTLQLRASQAPELARKFVFKITIADKTSLAPCEDTLQLCASKAPEFAQSSFLKISIVMKTNLSPCKYA